MTDWGYIASLIAPFLIAAGAMWMWWKIQLGIVALVSREAEE